MALSLFQSLLMSKSTSIFVPSFHAYKLIIVLINAAILGMDVPTLGEEKSQEVQPKYFQ